MYAEDHPPPHFHAVYQGAVAVFSIETGEILRGQIPERAVRLVREWADMHRDELTENWRRIEVPEQPLPIAPLP